MESNDYDPGEPLPVTPERVLEWLMAVGPGGDDGHTLQELAEFMDEEDTVNLERILAQLVDSRPDLVERRPPAGFEYIGPKGNS